MKPAKPPLPDPPIPVLHVLSRAREALVYDTKGVFKLPGGGDLEVKWLARKSCYRITLDVAPDYWPDGEGKSERWGDAAHH